MDTKIKELQTSNKLPSDEEEKDPKKTAPIDKEFLIGMV